MYGKLILSRDLNVVPMYMQYGPTFVIELDDNMNFEQRVGYIPNMMCGSILLPPYSIMSAAIDGSLPLDVVEKQFFDYLHSNEPLTFLAGIIALMIKGNNVIIMAEKVDPAFDFIIREIMNFFMVRYGIVVETQMQVFSFPVDPMYLDTIFTDLFVFDYMDEETFKKMHSPHPYSTEADMKLRALGNNRIMNTQGLVNPFVNLR